MTEQRWRAALPYAWYVRVADLAGFLQTVTGVLESRTASSAAAGHTGELLISFVYDGLRLSFKSRRLVSVRKWQRPQK